jgi:putative transposase
MSAQPRTYLTGAPYHILQWAFERQACFIEQEDYLYYLHLCQELASSCGVAIHAYCLMPNHVHFLLTQEKEDGITRFRHGVNSRHTDYINRKYDYDEQLWENHYLSSFIEPGRFLLGCSRYIELNPYRAGLVKRPEAYQWSSYGSNAWGDESWIDPHEDYLRLGPSVKMRCLTYRSLFKARLSDIEATLFGAGISECSPIGNPGPHEARDNALHAGDE